jgi:hypothetical protein
MRQRAALEYLGWLACQRSASRRLAAVRDRLAEAARRGDEVTRRELETEHEHLVRELAGAEAGVRDARAAMDATTLASGASAHLGRRQSRNAPDRGAAGRNNTHISSPGPAPPVQTGGQGARLPRVAL